MDYCEHIAEKIELEGIEKQEIKHSIEIANEKQDADYALPCFKFSKQLKKSPNIIAEEIAKNFIVDEYIKEVQAVNGYLNFKVNIEHLARSVFAEILAKKPYASSDMGKGKTICIDYSSINIAKPFHIGHLSTTVIGGALCRMYEHLGYNVVGINHLGDWGTQFGKLITAYKKWGSKEDIEKHGIKSLLNLYVRFHEQAEKDKELENLGREWFLKIEKGDSEAMQIFEWFKELTLKEAQKTYDLLNIKFQSYAGESFYNDKMQPIIDELKSSNLLQKSEDAMVVDLSEYDMPPCLIVKSDGATLYATRDLAAAEYRKATYDFYKSLYVVAYQQNLHFKQFFKVLSLMGRDWAKDLIHVPFGMVSYEGQALSTRKGNIVFLQDVLEKSIQKAYDIINEKNPNLEGKEQIAKKVGIGAVVFFALHSSRIKDISFSYDRVLSFDGETAPYVQYTFARCQSVLQKAKIGKNIAFSQIGKIESELISKISALKDIIINATCQNEPSMITRHVVEICKLFNKFYYDNRIICDDEPLQNLRLMITKSVMTAIKTGFSLLGIELPDKM